MYSVTYLLVLVCGLTLVFSIRSVTSQEASADQVSAFKSDWPVGDPRRCQEHVRASDMEVKRFEVLPGLGWDNLRNLEAGLVVVYNFSLCRLTNDGRFLVPDSVNTLPLKTSEVETFAQLIDHWQNSSSLTSSSINVEAGVSIEGKSISGKFSREHETLKSKQIEDKAVTVRVQLRYNRYEAKLQPDPQLSPQFKSRLYSIAARVELNQTDHARYEAQLVVRDFGTHVLTSVTAGAAVVKDDFIKREFVANHSQDKKDILASASGSFLGKFKLSPSYGHKTDKNLSNSYESSTTHSSLKSFGGPLVIGTNISFSSWADGVDANLVAMDRSGDPLYLLISPATLPELPASTVAEVGKHIRHAVEIYYQMNIRPGCTALGSPKFDVSANFDDGSCSARPTNNTFGGIFQTCTVYGTYLNNNPCKDLDQVNPKTGKHSCPPSFTQVRVHKASKTGNTEYKRNCKKCGVFKLFKCCHNNQYRATAFYETYWCAALGPVEPESGYRFGGVYTGATENLVTRDMDCPPGYYARRMFADLHVCISDDFERDTAQSVPFGGFFSCTTGNPLAVPGIQLDGSTGAGDLGTKPYSTLKSFYAKNSGPSTWPLRCPEGYSQHLATTDAGCAIHFCVESGALSGPNMPPVRRPPFVIKPPTPVDTEDNIVMFNTQTQTWMKNEHARQFLNNVRGFSGEDSDDGSDFWSVGTASGISVACTLVLVLITTLVVFGIRRRRERRQRKQSRLLRSEKDGSGTWLSESQGDYGSLNIQVQE